MSESNTRTSAIRPLFLSGIVIALDQWTKWLALCNLDSFNGKPIIHSFFKLILVKNYGAAFGFLSDFDHPWKATFLIVISIMIVLYLGKKYLFDLAQGWPVKIAISLIIGGAVGNIIDRISRGYVVDFLDVYIGQYHWPTFNFADSCITIGIFIFVLNIFGEDKLKHAS